MLNPAAYNPRTIDASSRKRLRDSIKRDGLVETLVWNRQTGTLVSGHQRLSVLDELEGGQDYEIEVAVIDVSPTRERELNVRLNNEQLTGSFDLEKLQEMVAGVEDINLDALGFSPGDTRDLFPDQLDPEGLFNPTEELLGEIEKLEQTREATKAARPPAVKDAKVDPEDGEPENAGEPEDDPESEEGGEGAILGPEELEAIKIAKIKAAKKEGLEKAREADRAAYVNFIFGSHAELMRFLKAADLPDQAVQDGRTLAQRMDIDLDQLE